MGGLSKKEKGSCHQEASLLKRMAHPNICAFLDSFMAAQGTTLCIVMAFCDGATCVPMPPMEGEERGVIDLHLQRGKRQASSTRHGSARIPPWPLVA